MCHQQQQTRPALKRSGASAAPRLRKSAAAAPLAPAWVWSVRPFHHRRHQSRRRSPAAAAAAAAARAAAGLAAPAPHAGPLLLVALALALALLLLLPPRRLTASWQQRRRPVQRACPAAGTGPGLSCLSSGTSPQPPPSAEQSSRQAVGFSHANSTKLQRLTTQPALPSTSPALNQPCPPAAPSGRTRCTCPAAAAPAAAPRAAPGAAQAELQ